jgi:hypothetical protein
MGDEGDIGPSHGVRPARDDEPCFAREHAARFRRSIPLLEEERDAGRDCAARPLATS